MIEIEVKEETIVNLRGCSQEAIDSLGRIDVLKVTGELNLRRCRRLIELPEGLVVGGRLILSNCEGLTKLPDDLKVGGSLDLYQCTKLLELPDGLVVMGRLDLRFCEGITMLPEDLQVVGKIWYSSVTGFSDRKDEPGVIPGHLKHKLEKYKY